MIGYEPMDLDSPPPEIATFMEEHLKETGLLERADHTGIPTSIAEAKERRFQGMSLLFEKELCGYLLYKVVHDHIFLAHYYVAPSYQKRGVGKQAFELLLQGPWKTIPLVRLFVPYENDAVREFWEEIGFDGTFLGMELDRIRRSKHAKSCGFVVYSRSWGKTSYLLVQHEDDLHWGFPKGHVEVGESEEETAFRETEEEVGLRPSLINGFCHRLHYLTPKGKRKEVVLFLGRLRRMRVPHPKAGEIRQAVWLPYEEARTTITYDNSRLILDQAERFLNGKSAALPS